MRLTHLHLVEFRRYRSLDIEIPAEGLLLRGRNASGKSTVLEAVRMLSLMRSPRSTHDRDVINWASGEEYAVAPYARVVGTAIGTQDPIQIELGMQRAADGIGPLQKQIKVNQQSRRMIDAIGTIRTVLFTPEDLDLVNGSPSGRRRFMDLLISQLDRNYVRNLSRYQRVLEQRNSLLKANLRNRESRTTLIEQLGFWDQQLIEHGAYISASRRGHLLTLCSAFSLRSAAFTETARLTAAYAPNLGGDFLAASKIGDSPEHMLAVARREMETQIRMRRDEELRRGVTVIGPHRDDIDLLIDGRSLLDFGSRGQQRLAVMALKLAEIDVIAADGDVPILLLDDVLSELDRVHRDALITAVRQTGAQLFITTADLDSALEAGIQDLPIAIVAGETIQIAK